MKRLILLILFTSIICYCGFAQYKVFLLHGYANPKSIMRKIDKDLKKEGFNTENYAYPGLYTDLDTIAQKLYLDIIKENLDSVSFVTHSMGGLVVRAMLKYSDTDTAFPLIYRIVMISPPNQGADIADFFKSKNMFHKLLGPNVKKMETDSTSYANQLPIPCNTEMGIIIGKRGKKKGYNLLIEGDNDGLIKPEHTLLGNETDTISLELDHLALVFRKKSRTKVIKFVKTGHFR
ncbi:MAG: hypothetical protein PHP52_09295 [Bacteroidales bacterium]|nr:hypothetical protein [Bacteroidales bacterium]MDD4216435.1 hypothetical protein [Bacteroidales bacterium]MDY0141244.1 hypothetical protein [Bacteroidales bacterium]